MLKEGVFFYQVSMVVIFCKHSIGCTVRRSAREWDKWHKKSHEMRWKRVYCREWYQWDPIHYALAHIRAAFTMVPIDSPSASNQNNETWPTQTGCVSWLPEQYADRMRLKGSKITNSEWLHCKKNNIHVLFTWPNPLPVCQSLCLCVRLQCYGSSARVNQTHITSRTTSISQGAMLLSLIAFVNL